MIYLKIFVFLFYLVITPIMLYKLLFIHEVGLLDTSLAMLGLSCIVEYLRDIEHYIRKKEGFEQVWVKK